MELEKAWEEENKEQCGRKEEKKGMIELRGIGIGIGIWRSEAMGAEERERWIGKFGIE